MGDVEMERKRPKHRHPKKRPAKTVKDLTKLLSELHQLRAQLQKAEIRTNTTLTLIVFWI